MPLEGVSQGFKDISASFKSHPLTNDVIGLKNANAIARSVRNIVMTFPGEKPFNPNFGSFLTDKHRFSRPLRNTPFFFLGLFR